MKKYLLGIVLSVMAMQSFAFPTQQDSMRNYLQKIELQQNLKPKVFSFDFNEMNIGVLKTLLHIEKKINLIIDPSVNTQDHFPIHLRNSNFFEFLEVTTRNLGLRYQVLDPKTIRVYK